MKKLIFVLISGGALALMLGVVWFSLTPKAVVEKKDIESEQTAIIPQVIAAKYPIQEGAILREQDFRWVDMEVSKHGQLTEVFLKDFTDMASLEGSLLTRSLGANQALNPLHIVRPEQAHYMSSMLSPGMRAITLELTLAGVSYGMLRAGNYVDVLLTSDNDHVSPEGFGAVTKYANSVVLENTRLLAINKVMTSVVSGIPADDREQQFDTTGKDTLPVTFEVTPQGAQRLLLASKLGDLSLMLRGKNKTDEVVTGNVTLWDEQVSENYHPNSKPTHAIRIFNADQVHTQQKTLAR